MSEDLLIRCCAPTLAGIKTGSLFSCPYESRESLTADLRALNRTLCPCGLRILPMRLGKGRALLYLYRPERLQRDLKSKSAREILEQAGYGGLKQEQCVLRLMKRLRENDEFPHEIGLFLSYPPEDVRGFREHRGKGCKLVGCWKVYGNADKARRTFEQYRKCTESYCRSLAAGFGIGQLAVSV